VIKNGFLFLWGILLIAAILFPPVFKGFLREGEVSAKAQYYYSFLFLPNFNETSKIIFIAKD